jgi:hypothetical protein
MHALLVPTAPVLKGHSPLETFYWAVDVMVDVLDDSHVIVGIDEWSDGAHAAFEGLPEFEPLSLGICFFEHGFFPAGRDHDASMAAVRRLWQNQPRQAGRLNGWQAFFKAAIRRACPCERCVSRAEA